MNSINSINSVLNQPASPKADNKDINKKGDGSSFGKQINKMLGEVNDLQLNAGKIADQFAHGEIEDIHEVMIAAEKASVSLELVLEVRNKLIEAYREMMRVQM